MVYFSRIFTVVSIAFGVVNAMPFQKAIAQVVNEATTDWKKACLYCSWRCRTVQLYLAKGIQCSSRLRITLRAVNCSRRDSHARKAAKNNVGMIRLAQLYVQQPRNAPDSLQVSYCKTAPKNTELAGLFHCQFAGSKFPRFSGDQTENVPFGVSAVNPPGSCPANPTGPIPDGKQLNKITTNPGKGSAESITTARANAKARFAATGVIARREYAKSERRAFRFTLGKGKDVKSLNSQFKGFSQDSPCTEGSIACIRNSLGKCTNGKLVTTPCAAGLTCVALPLINSRGISATCETPR